MDRWALLFLLMWGFVGSNADYPPPCDSEIYCHGKLLHTIQMAGLFKDSKTFVDMKLRSPPNQVLRNFELFMSKHHDKPSNADIRAFVNSNFEDAGSEFDVWNPEDWHPDPSFLLNISDPGLRTWASQLHDFWKELGRKIKDDVKTRPELYSMIYTSHPVIVPGGRFREFFYWDSYWIMKGLLLSEMTQTVRGMLENFVEMVNLLGYVPNGGRVYFRRSQPPLLIPMVKMYLDHTKDFEFVKNILPALEKEFNFWMRNRSLTLEHHGKTYRVIRYNVEYTGPRPESYREDYELAEKLQSEEEKHELYFNLKSGAESGWDFSSRWFVNSPEVKGDLGHTKVRDIIPVELNAFIQLNAKLLADFNRMAGYASRAAEYDNIANEWRTMINELLWDHELGCWFDMEITNRTLRKEFYPSNIVPLWTGAYESSDVDRVVQYLRNSGALDFPGGVPTSLNHAGEQWDFPNGWAPLQHIVIDALDNTANNEAKALAFELAEKWISSNYKAFQQSKKMFEKYDVTVVGLPGGGGEYEVVVGFGWTNGVVLDFLHRYGDRMVVPLDGKTNMAAPMPSYTSNSIVFGSVSVLLASILGISKIGKCKETCIALNCKHNSCVEYEQLPLEDEGGVLPSEKSLPVELQCSSCVR